MRNNCLKMVKCSVWGSTHLLLFGSGAIERWISVELLSRVSHGQLADLGRVFPDALQEVVQLAHRSLLDGLPDARDGRLHLFGKSVKARTAEATGKPDFVVHWLQ